MYLNTKLTSLTPEQVEAKMLSEIKEIFKRYGYDKTEPMARYKQPNKKYK